MTRYALIAPFELAEAELDLVTGGLAVAAGGSGTDLTLAGTISGAFEVTKIGAGTLDYSGNVSNTGTGSAGARVSSRPSSSCTAKVVLPEPGSPRITSRRRDRALNCVTNSSIRSLRPAKSSPSGAACRG